VFVCVCVYIYIYRERERERDHTHNIYPSFSKVGRNYPTNYNIIKMVRVSNTILAIFNCITLLIGLVIMGLGLYIFARGSATGCDKALQNPMIIVGAAISAISLFGLIGSCCRVNFALTLYLILLSLLLLCLIGFTVFAILVTNESIGKAFSKTKIMDFHNWLRDNLGDEKHWNDIIKSCAVQTKICHENNHKKLSDIQVHSRFSRSFEILTPSSSSSCLFNVDHL